MQRHVYMAACAMCMFLFIHGGKTSQVACNNEGSCLKESRELEGMSTLQQKKLKTKISGTKKTGETNEEKQKLESENAPTPPPVPGCDGWCKEDIARHGKERLCYGNMKSLCGKCSFCGTTPPPAPAPPTPGGNSWSTLCKDPQPMGTGHGWWKKKK